MTTSDPLGGPLPQGWTLSTIGKICDGFGGEVQTGPFGSQLHAEDYVADGIPYVMPKDMIDGFISESTVARVSEQDASRLATHRLREGDILYARRGDIGRRALVTSREEGWLCGTGCLRIRTNCPSLSPGYFTVYLGHPAVRKWVEDRAQGATMLNLNTTILRGVPVRIPPIAEQRHILDVLDKADAIRRKRKEAIALTEELLRSAFLEMFGDPVTNPKRWPKTSLGQLTTVTDGTHKTPTYVTNGVPFLSAKNIRANEIDWVNTRFITVEEHRELIRRCYPKLGDVLLTKSGTIGEAARVDRDLEFSLFESAALLKLDPERLLAAFLVALLNDKSTKRAYDEDIKGVAVKHLHLVDIRRLPVIVPPLAYQQEFSAFVNRVRELRAKHTDAVRAAEALFASLLHRAFRGELTAPTSKAASPTTRQLSFLE